MIHFGTEGMHWGIRNSPPYPIKRYRVRMKTGNMDPDEYRRAHSLWKRLKEFLGLSGGEKERIYEELDNNLSSEERKRAVVSKRIDNYLYTAINKGHNEYKIIGKERLEPARTWEEELSDILDAVIGPDWRKYDE